MSNEQNQTNESWLTKTPTVKEKQEAHQNAVKARYINRIRNHNDFDRKHNQ